ncbi:MAG: Gfo/Idh/MocA family oxidoreductase [Gammaproteobacteria bacterium]|nr:Gfo/Idh/MocA family oxidoreductase [Gammaproteobacteria bacterium]
MSSDNLPPSTPLDVRRGVTDVGDVAHPLRWGILGAGSISAQWVESLRACKGASVTAVAAREMSRAQGFADALDIPHAYDSYAEMAAADNVDIVYVGTITRLHKEHSLIAIEAGKHVLCEKPLAENVDDAREMYAAAEAKGVMLQDAMWTRFFPAVEHARHAIETGVIGDVSLVQSDFFDPIYTIQAAPLAFGADAEVTHVTAAGLRRGGAAIVEYGERGCAVLTFPPFNCELGEVTEIAGTKGRIMLGQPGHCPTNVTIRVPPQGGVPSRYRTRNAASPEERFDYPLPGNVAMARAFPNQHGFLYQAEAVHRCLAADLRECPQYGKAESLHAMDLLTRIQLARRTAA